MRNFIQIEKQKLKINIILFEDYKSLYEFPDFFHQTKYSRTALGIKKIGHDCKRLMKNMAF